MLNPPSGWLGSYDPDEGGGISKILEALRQQQRQTMEAISRREVSIRIAHYAESFYPDTGSKGMLPMSHLEHLARLAQIIADDHAVLADLRRQVHLIKARRLVAAARVFQARYPCHCGRKRGWQPGMR